MDALQRRVATGVLSDPDVVLYAATVSVWGRWFIWLVCVVLLAYRPGFWYPWDIEYLSIPVLLGVLNGLVHHRLLTNRPVTWRWMLFLSAADIALITAGIVIGGGFRSFIFLAYYPSLAVFAVVFSSFWLSLAWTTTAAVTYAVVCLRVGSGLDLDAGNEKVLMARLALMFIIVLGISFITRFERIRWRTSVSMERELRRERIELSQTIHDTTAQTAYMIGLGIHRARELAGDSNEDLVAALDATSALSNSAMWEVRGPIDAGHILEGRELGRVLWSHCVTFETITGVPAGSRSPSRTTGWVFPTAMPNAAGASAGCGRTLSIWAERSWWRASGGEGRPSPAWFPGKRMQREANEGGAQDVVSRSDQGDGGG